MASNLFRNIPSVTELIENTKLNDLIDRVSHHVVVKRARMVLDEVRNELRSAANESKVPSVTDLAERIATRIMDDERPRLQKVINATGILLHTGLGRAPMAAEAVAAMGDMGGGYASVEIDLKSGDRSQRVWAVEGLLKELTGAEAAVVVNNNAGATMLTLAALTGGREVVVSRGQLIEIGGSFRLPDIMETSGATMREVGTTNKTRLSDYENAINENTGAIFRAHPSNYVVVGFTADASLAELVELSHKKNIAMIDDIGSGALIDFAEFGLNDEPLASRSIEAGADVVLFSGDKLLGGPQCGIVVGKKKYIDKLAKHPMMRALRIDKVTMAALYETLKLYRDPEKAKASIPLLKLLSIPAEDLHQRANSMVARLSTSTTLTAEAVEDVAYLGGGSVPTQQIPTWCVAITPADGKVNQLSATLRNHQPAIMGRVQQDRYLIDLRTVFEYQDRKIVNALDQLTQGEDEEEVDGAGEY